MCMKKNELICCRLKRLPKSMLVEAARTATRINPVNHPRMDQLAGLMRGFRATPQRIAVMTTSYWGSAGVKLILIPFQDETNNATLSSWQDHEEPMSSWSHPLGRLCSKPRTSGNSGKPGQCSSEQS